MEKETYAGKKVKFDFSQSVISLSRKNIESIQHQTVIFNCNVFYSAVQAHYMFRAEPFIKDVNVKIIAGHLVTNLYRKEMDRNNILRTKSFHNPRIIKAIPKGQYLRAKKIASSDLLFEKAALDLTDRFKARGYSSQKLENKSLLAQKPRGHKNSALTFVSKYDNQSKEIEKVIKQFWPLLQMDKDYGHLFTEFPQFAYRRGPTLRDLISPTEPRQKEQDPQCRDKIGTFPCYNCNCCTSIIKGPNIHHPTKGTEIKLRAIATCMSTYVVY
ncbi:hypothetical protein XELAEV_18011426mg [Xenopus laevis]|uniref:Helix-turn-helix domain-containing protein n=1 Tax=Xenopus laevis TaxID=8355 RepID=A0A974HXA9_XENLA|nr:hypothetical protein XELAEV_18011426mg [Xenopus laevis]